MAAAERELPLFPTGTRPHFLLWSIPTLCACAYMHILSNCGCLFLCSLQILLFVLSRCAILAHTIGSLFFYYEIFHVCLIFKVQQYFVNLLYNFHDLLYGILYTFFSAQKVLGIAAAQSDFGVTFSKVATKSCMFSVTVLYLLSSVRTYQRTKIRSDDVYFHLTSIFK